MCISPDGSFLYVIQFAQDDILQVDCITHSVSGSLSLLEPYDYCSDLCLNDQGNELYALCGSKIFIIDERVTSKIRSSP